MPRVFISHSTLDRAIVEERIIQPLTANGIATWYAKQDIRTAEEWERSILQGLKECDWFLVVMSRSSAESRWVRSEVHWACDERQQHIVPVLIEDCDPDKFHIMLRQIQSIDLRANTSSAVARLLEVWGVLPAKQSSPAVIAPTPPEKPRQSAPPRAGALALACLGIALLVAACCISYLALNREENSLGFQNQSRVVVLLSLLSGLAAFCLTGVRLWWTRMLKPALGNPSFLVFALFGTPALITLCLAGLFLFCPPEWAAYFLALDARYDPAAKHGDERFYCVLFFISISTILFIFLFLKLMLGTSSARFQEVRNGRRKTQGVRSRAAGKE
jgi:hypothetical protein